MAAATGTEDEEDTVVLLGIPGKRMRQVESEPTETPKSFLAKTGHSAYESWIGGEAVCCILWFRDSYPNHKAYMRCLSDKCVPADGL